MQTLTDANTFAYTALPDFEGTAPAPAPKPPPASRTVSYLLDTYLASLSGVTLRDCKSLLNKWARPALGHIPLEQLGPRDVEQLHAEIPPTRSANAVVDYLHAALRRAERWGWIPRGTNPAAFRGEYKHRERPRKRILSADERRAMWRYLEAEEASGVKHRVLRSQGIQLLARTGLRKGEIIGLPWSAVDLEAELPTAYIAETKTGEPKTCRLAPRAVELLRRVQTEGMVFPWSSSNPLDVAWRRLREACGFPDVVLHDLRRTFWSLIGEAGIPVEDACATSGHRDQKIHVSHYRHISDERVAEISALGDELMSG